MLEKRIYNIDGQEIEVEESSGNVFADLGLPNPEERLMKATLSIEIERAIKKRGLTQEQAAKIMGVDQPKVSAIVRGRLSGFSMERLTVMLMRLGKDVELVVREKPAERTMGAFTLRQPGAARRKKASGG